MTVMTNVLTHPRLDFRGTVDASCAHLRWATLDAAFSSATRMGKTDSKSQEGGNVAAAFAAKRDT